MATATTSRKPGKPAKKPARPAKPVTTGKAHQATHTFDIYCALRYSVAAPTDFLFLLHAQDGGEQKLLRENLQVSNGNQVRVYADPAVGHRFTRIRAKPGELELHYSATVRRKPRPLDKKAQESPVAQIPDAILHNLMPTRYCESDLLGRAALMLFGDLPPGIARVQAVSDWIYDNIDYELGSTQSTTSAADVFLSRAGVCRDFAHLGVTFCRALNIPARLVVGYAIFDAPPPDFHAVFEAYVGKRWVVFDPTRMSPPEQLVRIASGRDAKDVAFATIFGPATMLAMDPQIRRID